MNHFMLPEDASTGPNNWLDPSIGLATRYGSYAMESLINDLLKLGATRERLEIKVFGGGRVLSGVTDVGARNIAFVRSYLQLEGYRILAEDLGGTTPRKVFYFPATGRVTTLVCGRYIRMKSMLTVVSPSSDAPRLRARATALRNTSGRITADPQFR